MKSMYAMNMLGLLILTGVLLANGQAQAGLICAGVFGAFTVIRSVYQWNKD